MLIPFYGTTQSTDSITISKEFYQIIGTCPIYLNECEQLRTVDSISLELIRHDLSNEQIKNGQLVSDNKRLRKNVIKSGVIGVCIGFLISLLL